jgi:predicted HTH transcriptional regulator
MDETVLIIENNIACLRNNGYVERVGSRKNGYWKVLQMQ